MPKEAFVVALPADLNFLGVGKFVCLYCRLFRVYLFMYLYIYGLFDHTLSSSVCSASNDRMTKWRIVSDSLWKKLLYFNLKCWASILYISEYIYSVSLNIWIYVETVMCRCECVHRFNLKGGTHLLGPYFLYPCSSRRWLVDIKVEWAHGQRKFATSFLLYSFSTFT
jgi:hypothetical protein